MGKETTVDRLDAIESRLSTIEARIGQFVSPDEIRIAIQDVLETLNLVSQMASVHNTQREQLAMLVGLAAQLLTETRQAHSAGSTEREQIGALLVQLRELGRKHVAALTDLERTIEGAVEKGSGTA
jgi:hypothetical protein